MRENSNKYIHNVIHTLQYIPNMTTFTIMTTNNSKWTLWPFLGSLHLLHLSHSLADRWGTKDDRATTVLHSSLFSAFRRASPNFNPVHSVMLSSHLFFCLPLLPLCTVPCRIIFASPVDLVLCPYHLSFRFFTVVRRSS